MKLIFILAILVGWVGTGFGQAMPKPEPPRTVNAGSGPSGDERGERVCAGGRRHAGRQVWIRFQPAASLRECALSHSR